MMAAAPVRHVPVLGREAVAMLAPREGGLYVDATFGAGGYSRAILAIPGTRVIGIDRDRTAIAGGFDLVDEAAEPMKFFVGYAGWSPLQLEAELAEGAWRLGEIPAGHVLETPDGLWEVLHSRANAAARQSLRPAVDPKRIPPDPSVN